MAVAWSCFCSYCASTGIGEASLEPAREQDVRSAVRRREAAIVELVESVDQVRFLFAGAGEDVHDW